MWQTSPFFCVFFEKIPCLRDFFALLLAIPCKFKNLMNVRKYLSQRDSFKFIHFLY
jgi:hypothetical protein